MMMIVIGCETDHIVRNKGIGMISLSLINIYSCLIEFRWVVGLLVLLLFPHLLYLYRMFVYYFQCFLTPLLAIDSYLYCMDM